MTILFAWSLLRPRHYDTTNNFNSFCWITLPKIVKESNCIDKFQHLICWYIFVFLNECVCIDVHSRFMNSIQRFKISSIFDIIWLAHVTLNMIYLRYLGFSNFFFTDAFQCIQCEWTQTICVASMFMLDVFRCSD